jgi:hypothetical protein
MLLSNSMDRHSDPLEWLQFARYTEISVFLLQENYMYGEEKIQESLDFAKEIIEGKAPAPIVDESVRSQEMSLRGALGGQASAKRNRGLSARARKTKQQSATR